MRSPTIYAYLILGIALISGIFLVDDYGVHWDEHSQYNHGLVTAQYINELCRDCLSDKPFSETRLEEYKDRTHGVVFQMFALGIQNLLGLDDIRQFLLLRHILTFLIFWLSLIFLYKVFNKYLKNKWITVAGLVIFSLSPRIFAESFYNSKDIVFLSLTIFSTWTLLQFLEKPGYRTLFFHALTSALLIATRVPGIFMPASTLILFTIRPFFNENKKPFSITAFLKENKMRFLHASLFLAVYLVATGMLIIVFWPYLWQSPLKNFAEIFTSMSHFPWDDPVLFAGSFITPNALPFYYVPLWIAITTPVLNSLLFLTGLGFIFSGKSKGLARFYDLVPVVLLFFPLLSVILLHSVLYDGWRQMYFLYVPFIIIAMRGLDMLINWICGMGSKFTAQWMRRIVFMLVIGSAAFALVFIVSNHPNQQVYFNFMASKQPVNRFEGDYWGLSYRSSLEYLLKSDPSDTILVCGANWPAKANADILPKRDRDRLKFTDWDKATYFISNHRFPPEHNKFMNKEYPYNQAVYEVNVKDYVVSGVYKLGTAKKLD